MNYILKINYKVISMFISYFNVTLDQYILFSIYVTSLIDFLVEHFGFIMTFFSIINIRIDF